MMYSQAPLGDVCTKIGSGATPRGGDESYKPIGIALVRSMNIHNGRFKRDDLAFIDQSQAEKLKNVILEEDDVLLNITGASVARCCMLDNSVLPARVNQHVCILRPKKDVLDNQYLMRFLTSEQTQKELLRLSGAGATREAITKGEIEKFKVPLPPLAEQKRIAAILDAADVLRANRRESLTQLDALLQSTFLDMFGDPVMNPKGWDRKKLGDFINFVGGSQPPKDTFIYEPKSGYVRLVQIRDFKSDKYPTYIPEKLAKRPFTEDDVMIARYGPPVFQILIGLSGSYNVALMKAEPIGQVEKRFIFHLLNLPVVNAAVVAQSERTAGQTGVNLKFLNDYLAYLPPYSLQQRFTAIVECIEHQKARLREHLDELDTLFASLQHCAFNGEL